MKRADFKTDAAYYRHHREVFNLALELGCTPAMAEQEMQRIERHERHRALCDRKGFRSAIPDTNHRPNSDAFRDWNAPHMMRN